MELKHHFTVPSSLEDTWRSFNQLEEIAPCFPGATLTGVEGDTFTGTVKIKLGPIAMLYAGAGTFLSRDEANHTVVIEAQGKDKRGNGTAGATVTAVLAASGDGTTVDVSTDMNVTGKPAQFGRGVIQDISDKLLEQFVQCVIRKATALPDEVAGDALDGSDGSAASGGLPVPAATADSNSTGNSAGPAAARFAAQGPGDAPAPPKAARQVAASREPTAELNLGSAVFPVLAKRFGPAIVAVLAVLGIVLLIRRKRRS